MVVACGGGDGGATDGNESIELNAIVRSVGPSPVERLEYSIDCSADEGSEIPDETRLDGELEPENGQATKTGMLDASWSETWAGFVDLPPGSCWVQLRGRDGDGEVICSADVPFSVVPDTATFVVVPLSCPLSGYPRIPEISFNVCPDLRALRCDELDPVEASASCLVSFLDQDNTCDRGCDPQSCIADGTVGLTCAPGPDPGVSTTISCTDALLDCTDDGTPDASCTFNAATPGAVQENAEELVGRFVVACVPPESGSPPGATITCTAVTSDGDIDCDRTRLIMIDCPDL